MTTSNARNIVHAVISATPLQIIARMVSFRLMETLENSLRKGLMAPFAHVHSASPPTDGGVSVVLIGRFTPLHNVAANGAESPADKIARP
jgi:hypothetical protein